MIKSEHPAVEKGQEITLDIDDLAFGGQGVSRFNDIVVFVDRAIPGQRIRARVYKRKHSYAEARLLEVMQQSSLYTKPVCTHFGECGGCALQHLDYAEQIKAKRRQVIESLERLGGFTGIDVAETLPSPDTYFYRNKMEFSFSRQRWLSPAEFESVETADEAGVFLGLHAKRFYDKIVDVENCFLLHPKTNDIVREVRDFARSTGLPAYSTLTHSGFWRFLVMRHAKSTDELMVNLIVSRYDPGLAADFAGLISSRFPEVSSLLYSVSTSKASVAFAEKEYPLAGKNSIVERIGYLEFEVSSGSFFQTNSRQAQRLYDVVADYAKLSGSEIVYDLYCGAGTISLYLSDRAKRVIGFEAVESAIADAQRNARRNSLTNCEFVLGDLRDRLSETEKVLAEFGQPDVLIIDPPRGGMHPKTVQAVLKLSPTRIVHVSCNPTTLARDLKILCESQYQLVKVQPVDMFPHTAHIEVVAKLEKR